VSDQRVSDQLSSGREHEPRSRRPAVVLAVVLALGGAAELGERHREQIALLSCVRSAEADAAYTDRRVRATASYVGSGLGPSTPVQVRVSLEQVLARTARDGLAPAVRARQRCERQRVMPWHGLLRTAHSRYVVLLEDREASLTRGAVAPVDLPARKAALSALVTALPGSRAQLGRLLSP